MLSSKTNALLTHTLASFWRKQSCVICSGWSTKESYGFFYLTGQMFLTSILKAAMIACVFNDDEDLLWKLFCFL